MPVKFTRRQATMLLSSAVIAAPYIARAKSAAQAKLEGATVNMLAVQFAHHNHLWDQIPEFTKEYGIKVNIEFAPFDQTREKTLLEMSKKTGRFDLFTTDVMWLAEYASAGYLEPVAKYVKNKDLTTEDFDVNDFVPRIYSGTGVYNDTLYNIPFDAGSVGVEFRKDWMQAKGIAVPERFDGKWTHTAMYDAIKALHDPDKGVAGYVTQPQKWFWGWTLTPLLYAWQRPETIGNEFVDRDWNVTIASPENLAALKWYLSLREFTPRNDGNFGYGEVVSTYQQSKAAGGIHYTSFIADAFEADGMPIKGRSAYLHHPIGPYGRLDPFFGSWGLSISTDSRQKEAAWTFIQWATGRKAMEQSGLKGGGLVRHSQYQNKDIQAAMKWNADLYPLMLKFADPDERIRIPEWGEFSNEILGLYGNKAWLNEMTPEQALEAMEKSFTKLLKKGGYYAKGAKNPKQNWRDLSYYDRAPADWT
ncbi:multiple sugar transport system substrate-binding protein [Roseiarcus fermentans]|uniref:Multiple sugar transport system substrate-binding protein n=1 Tax=Roseiarcus fermentans TaxID=1473586 RepID=A0A366FWK5_9HYPH|nr:extracellular solute-binding protein [Roseiarcus fermentans]RBP18125.1 multiple sugar transport system substrate-binding protein [Roseiarcus fermentans]